MLFSDKLNICDCVCVVILIVILPLSESSEVLGIGCCMSCKVLLCNMKTEVLWVDS